MDVDSPEFLQNPYPFYARRRESGPIFRRSERAWTLTGYEALNQFLADSAAGRGNVGRMPNAYSDKAFARLKENNPALATLDQWMLFQNPPEHGQTRAGISSLFTHRAIQVLETRMRRTATELVAGLSHRVTTSFDFARTLAYQFPITVISDLIGIPAQDRALFHRWNRDFSAAVQVDFFSLVEEQRIALNRSAVEIQRYFEAQILGDERGEPSELVARLIARNESDLDLADLLANCAFLLFAGQETTTSLLTNAVAALLNHPLQLKLLRDNPELMDNAVEECLRFDPSIQMVGRFTLDDVEVCGVMLPKGSHVFAFIGAAGRDPTINDKPDEFDIQRDSIKHLAFARGTHHCLGAVLARLEIKIMLEQLIDAFPNLAFATAPVRRPTWLMRGYDSMPLRSVHD